MWKQATTVIRSQLLFPRRIVHRRHRPQYRSSIVGDLEGKSICIVFMQLSESSLQEHGIPPHLPGNLAYALGEPTRFLVEIFSRGFPSIRPLLETSGALHGIHHNYKYFFQKQKMSCIWFMQTNRSPYSTLASLLVSSVRLIPLERRFRFRPATHLYIARVAIISRSSA